MCNHIQSFNVGLHEALKVHKYRVALQSLKYFIVRPPIASLQFRCRSRPGLSIGHKPASEPSLRKRLPYFHEHMIAC
jgi:hypothetical protein